MLGISNDHTLAATISPLANPNSVFCSRSGISFFMKNTNADPSIVPVSGNNIPINTVLITIDIFDCKDTPFFLNTSIPTNGYLHSNLRPP